MCLMYTRPPHGLLFCGFPCRAEELEGLVPAAIASDAAQLWEPLVASVVSATEQPPAAAQAYTYSSPYRYR